MFKNGDLNPHWFFYPSFMFDLNAIAYSTYFLIGRALGFFVVPGDLLAAEVVTMGVGRLTDPNLFLLSRGLNAAFSAGAVFLTYFIGRRLHSNRAVANLAALLLAVSPAAVITNQVISADAFALFFTLFSLAWSVRIVDDPRLKNYILAGIGAGLAVSSKYNAALILLPLLVAHFLRFGLTGWKRKELYFGLAASAAAYLITSPYTVLDFATFMQGLGYQAYSYTVEGHAGQEGNAFSWYITYLLSAEGLVVVLGFVQLLYILCVRSKAGLVLISFPVVYFLTISQFIIRNERTVSLIIPFLALLAAWLLVSLYDKSRGLAIPQVVRTGAFLVIAAYMLFMPLQITWAADQRLTQIDGRETARQWLDANLPPGTRVAEEAYSPYIDTRRFVAQGVYAMTDHPLDWYGRNGFEYLVFSWGMYGRFVAEPAQYPDEVQKYQEFFSHLAEVKHFSDNGYEIRIFKTGAVIPAHRVAARFGNYGEIIELVGYDDVEPKWMPGQPLQVRLAWRALAEKSEPLQVSLRLLDQDNREIASTSGDLFQGKGWGEGIFSTDWTIPVKSEIAPGAYRLEVNVIQTRFNYRTPAQNWAGDNIERVDLGPFKLSAFPPPSSELQAAQPANVRFGEAIMLLAYTAKTSARAGDSLPVTLYWQTAAKPPRDYTVFIHLVDSDGKVVAQMDAQPHGGAYPTSEWDDGEIVRDDFALKLPTDLASSSYGLELGLYEYPSLARLTVVGASNQVLGDHWVLPDPVQVTR